MIPKVQLNNHIFTKVVEQIWLKKSSFEFIHKCMFLMLELIFDITLNLSFPESLDKILFRLNLAFAFCSNVTNNLIKLVALFDFLFCFLLRKKKIGIMLSTSLHLMKVKLILMRNLKLARVMRKMVGSVNLILIRPMKCT